jgi:hypothetical protein
VVAVVCGGPPGAGLVTVVVAPGNVVVDPLVVVGDLVVVVVVG